MKENPFYDPTLASRNRRAYLFKWYTRLSVVLTVVFLCFFLFDMARTAYPALWQTYIKIEVYYSQKAERLSLFAVDKAYHKIVSRAWLREVPQQIKDDPQLLGTTATVWVLTDDQVDQYTIV